MSEISDLTAETKKVLKAVKDQTLKPAAAFDKRGREVVNPDAAPAVRKGADPLSSQPFRLTRLFGAMTGALSADEAKNEIRLVKALRKGLEETGGLIKDAGAGSVMLPVRKSFLKDESANHPAMTELLQAVDGSETDRDEVRWLARHGETGAVRKAAMSYLTGTTGGDLVAPAEFGEIIPLMRNKSAVDRAGARQIALPPQGKWVAPRITGPSTGYWITENAAITESNPTTGSVEMQAKKLAVLIRVPNELFKFASAASDALFREDIAKTLALGYDYACLYGQGGGGQPKGLVQYTGTNELIDYATTSPTPAGVAANGNTLRPEDGFRMAGRVEDRNFELDAFRWVMRPTLKAGVMSRRGDAVTTGDAAGVFVQSLTRLLGDSVGENWCGYPVVATSQIKNNYTKGGSGATLTEAFGGVWSEALQGLYGAVEFATNNMGEQTFIADQTLIRGILHCDFTLRFPGAFIRYKELLNS